VGEIARRVDVVQQAAPERRIGVLALMRRREVRGWAAVLVGLLLLALAIRSMNVVQGKTAVGILVRTTPPPAGSVRDGEPIPIVAVLGTGAGLSAPRAALALPSGEIAVADTGAARVTLLDGAGRLLRHIVFGSAPLAQPYALLQDGPDFDVLEAQSGTIDQFDRAGRFVRRVAQDRALQLGRGLAADSGGRFYVPNPLTNAILVLAWDGTIVRRLHSALTDRPGSFNQVGGVAVGRGGTFYVFDSFNRRVEALTAGGGYLAQWPVPAADTLNPIQILPLSGGGMLTVDPTGALLFGEAHGGMVVRHQLLLAGQPLRFASALLTGLSRMPDGRLRVTDRQSSRLFMLSWAPPVPPIHPHRSG